MPAWYVEGRPGRPVVIILAGNSGHKSATLSRWITLWLHAQGYGVFLMDTRGQGSSDGIKTYGIGEAVDLRRALDHLRTRFPERRIGAIGFSMGGALKVWSGTLLPVPSPKEGVAQMDADQALLLMHNTGDPPAGETSRAGGPRHLHSRLSGPYIIVGAVVIPHRANRPQACNSEECSEGNHYGVRHLLVGLPSSPF